MLKLIGLYSSAAQSGKSTVANYLRSRDGYDVVPFAQTLKEMALPMLIAMGYSEYQAHHLLTENKEFVLPIGVSVRHLLRTLGTEWGRSCIHPEVWLYCWRERIKYSSYVIVDDVRFPNEANLVKELGGTIVRIVRPGVQVDTTHSSEGGLDTYEGFDCTLVNNGDLQQLYSLIDQVL
jgi:hypothetical protein